MLRRVTWRLWAGFAIVLSAYVVLGAWFRANGAMEQPLYKWGLFASTFAPVIMLAGYTVSGSKWWKNSVGSSLGVVAFAVTWMSWPLAWTFLFWNGVLKPGWVAWTEVSGPAAIALALLWFTWVNLRMDRDARNGS